MTATPCFLSACASIWDQGAPRSAGRFSSPPPAQMAPGVPASGRGPAPCDDDQKHDGQQAFGVGIARVPPAPAQRCRPKLPPQCPIGQSRPATACRPCAWANRGWPAQRQWPPTSRMVSTNRAARQSSWPSWLKLSCDGITMNSTDSRDHGEVFLEVPQFLPLHQFHVANDQAHQGHAEQARLMLDPVAGPVADQTPAP